MQSEINYVIGMLFLFFAVWFGGLYGIHWLARRWYIKRNGAFRIEKYANAKHQKTTYWFAVLTFPLSISVGFLSELAAFITLCCLVLSILILTLYNIYIWKKESSNPDDFRFELYSALSMGGYSLILFSILFYYA